MFDSYGDIFSIPDLQEALGIGRSKCYELIHNNQINSFRIGNAIRIPKQSVIEYVTKECYNDNAVDGCVVTKKEAQQ